jgi:hypothetical protein
MEMLRKMKLGTIPRCLALGAMALALVVPVENAIAEDMALLIGVGDYKFGKDNDLPGIDLDLKMMQDNADLMGFHKQNVKVIRDSQATVEGVSAEFRNWLGRAGKDDRVLIYFSGHGYYVPDVSGDEEDGNDEVLCLYETKPVSRNGQKTLDGVMTDDSFATLLSGLNSENVLVVLDNCHSGTATKGFNLVTKSLAAGSFVTKMYKYDGVPVVHSKGSFPAAERGFAAVQRSKANAINYVALSACRDDEQSIATGQGSLFTLGLSRALKKSAGNGASITVEDMNTFASQFIGEELSGSDDRAQVFHPQINGNPNLYKMKIGLRRVSNGSGPGWRDVETLVQKSKSDGLRVELNKSEYKIGENVQITIKGVKKRGYLYVLTVSPDDEITILYPNQFNPERQVEAGDIELHNARMGFDITVVEPAGETLVAAIWSQKDLGAVKSGFRSGDEMLATLTPKGMSDMRGFVLEARAMTDAGMIQARVKK